MPTIRFGGVAVLACAALAWVLLTAGLLTPMYKSENGSSTTTITPFRMKVETPVARYNVDKSLLDVDEMCDEFKGRFRSIQAFGIIANLVAAIAAVAGGVGAFLPETLVPKAGLSVFGAAGLSVMASISALIAWAIVAGSYNGEICGSTVKSNFDYGPTIGLWITAWVLLLGGGVAGGAVGFVIDKVMDPPTEGKAPSAPHGQGQGPQGPQGPQGHQAYSNTTGIGSKDPNNFDNFGKAKQNEEAWL